mgnify:CR=1 FL=1
MKVSLSGILFEQGTIEESVKAAGEAGYHGIELRTNERHLPPSTTPEKSRYWRRIIQGYGMEVSCLASFMGRYNQKDDSECAADLEEFKRFAELAHELDCRLVRLLVGGPPSAQATEADWARPLAWLKKTEELAASLDVEAVIEIHNWDMVDAVEPSLKVAQEVGGKHLGFIYEPANMYIVGNEYRAQAVEALGDHILHVHVKDVVLLPSEKPPFRIMPLGQGEMDYLSVFRGLHHILYNGHVCVELAHGAHLTMDGQNLARRELQAVRSLIELTL